MEAALLDLRHTVPGIVALSFGATFTTARARGFTHVLSVRLASKEALAGYADHPAHVACVEKHIKPAVSAVLAVDAVCTRHETGGGALSQALPALGGLLLGALLGAGVAVAVGLAGKRASAQ